MRRPSRRRALALGLLAALGAAADAEIPPRQADLTPHAATPTRPADLADGAAVQQGADVAGLGAACDDAAFLLAAGRAREALGRLEPVLRLAGADHPLNRRGQDLMVAARAAEAREDSDGASNARLAAISEAQRNAEQTTGIRVSLRAERLARVRDLRARGHRELALAHLRALLHDLPADEEIDALFRELLDETHTARTAAIIEREQELRAEVSLRVERSLIPEGFDGRPIFPSDWSERRAGRHSLFDVPDEVPAWERAISDRLAARITVNFDASPFSEALAIISRLGGINVVAAPELLAASDRLVTLRAVGMRTEDVLTWIAEQAGTRWNLTNGAVFLGDAAQGRTVTAIHDIAEMLLGSKDFPGLKLDITATNGGSGGAAPAGFTAPTDSGTPASTADDIAELIRRSVSPRSWAVDGNAIAVRGTALLVTAPPDVQRLIREFLRAQSAQHSLAVRVDARWLELTDRYVEEIGVQWTSGQTQMIDPGANNRGGLIRRLDGWAIDGSTENQLPSTAMAVGQATAGTGLTLQGALVGGTRLSAVLSAVERNGQGRVLQAPELTCLNGQQANAFFGNQLAYISDYTVASGGDQGSIYDPVISILNLGAMIEVRPLVSADRKYVVLELRTAISTATLWTETIIAATTDTSTGIDTNGDGILDLFLGMGTSYPIELPNVAIRTAGTSVMLPDRGSLLVSGFNASLDQFANTRVPLLGSVPFLGRLFGSRGRYADKTKLYLLTTATIINYPELEARL